MQVVTGSPSSSTPQSTGFNLYGIVRPSAVADFFKLQPAVRWIIVLISINQTSEYSFYMPAFRAAAAEAFTISAPLTRAREVRADTSEL